MTFIGREAELDALRQAWLRRDEFPLQFVVLVGESRIGKTRVVQEFYRWLNSNQDHHNYWPDTLETAQDSLHVNPSFDGHEGSAAVLPWLWWGLRWTRPDARNPEESLRCAVISDADHLRPHLQAAQTHAAQRSAGGKAVAGVAKSAANLLTGGLLGPLIEFGERVQEWRELRTARNRGAAEIGERIDGQRVDELGSLTSLLLSMVGTDEVIEAGVPLILVLDDVHWADPAGLSFLLNLSREMLRRSTPQKPFPRAVVVATVWEREWNIAQDAPLSYQAESAPKSLSEAIRALEALARREALSMPRLEVLRLGRLSADLHPLVRESLPGLTQSQVELVAQRAGGSPGLLVEFLLKLSGRSRHLFKDGDPKQELTRRGETSVRDMQVSYHDLVEERLQALEPTEASVMRLASYVGLAYSRPFVAELAQLSAARDALLADQAAVEAALRRADHPLSIVQAASQRVDEFRLPVYRDILRRQLSESEQLWEGLVSDAMHVVRNWLEQDRVRDLAANERDAFLEFAVTELQAVAQGEGFVELGPALLMALAEVACNVELEALVSKAGRMIVAWRDSYRPMSEESLLRMGRRRLTGLFRCMQLVDDTATARRLAGDAIEVLRHAGDSAGPVLWTCLRYAGEIAQASDQLIRALESYREMLTLVERILAEFGPSSERLRDVSISKLRVADVLLRQDQVDEALGRYRESLTLVERILAEFGPSAQRLRDVSLSKLRVANVLLRQDQVDEALYHCRGAETDAEAAIARYGASGEHTGYLQAAKRLVSLALLRLDRKSEGLVLLEQYAVATGQDARRSWFKSPPDKGQSAELDDAYFVIESNPGRAVIHVTKALEGLWPELLAGRKLKTSVEKDVAFGDAALVTLTSEEPGDSEHAAFLWRRQLVVLLDGTSQPIHWARELGWMDTKTSQAALSFAALFGRYVYAHDGPFVLLRAPSDIPWTPVAEPADVARVDALEPFAPVSRPADGRNFLVEACVLFGSQLLRVRYRVPRRGGPEMIEAEAIASDLPVWRYRCEKGWHLRVLEELPGARV